MMHINWICRPRGSLARQKTSERTRWSAPVWQSYSVHCRSSSDPSTVAETASPVIINNEHISTCQSTHQ